MRNKFKGTGVAVITPFRNYGTVDFTALRDIIENLINNGVDYIVALGTTGETATLSADERLAVIDFVIEVVEKRVAVVVGIGGNSTQNVVDTIRDTNFDGIDAILSVCPYYNKPQQKGIYNHYKTIASASPVPLILYNVPGRTSVNMTYETTLKLANDFDNIIGIKEASGDLVQCMHIIKNKPKDFLVISGDDILTLPFLSIGGDGVISVIANAFPRDFSDLVRYALDRNLEEAQGLHYKLLEIMRLI